MPIIHLNPKNFKPELVTTENLNLLPEAVWIDLLNPSLEEKKQIENILGVKIPTKEDMQEIEVSSRLYQDNDYLFMTVMMIAKSDSPTPEHGAITLILGNNKLITIRYIEPQSFALFNARISKLPSTNNALVLFIELLDTAIDRLGDILEKVSHRIDTISQAIFHPQQEKMDYTYFLREIGSCGDLGTRVQESLLTFNRLISFFEQNVHPKLNENTIKRVVVFEKDINSLSDYVIFLTTKVNFLLDATLGMVNIEQNAIIKIFSIVAVILLPPTLVASIYGMNFHNIPELSWKLGYPISLLLMIISAWLPYKFFKKKGWL